MVHLALNSLTHPEAVWFLTKPQWEIIAVGATAEVGGLFLLNLGLIRFNVRAFWEGLGLLMLSDTMVFTSVLFDSSGDTSCSGWHLLRG